MKFKIKVGDTVAIRTHRQRTGKHGSIEEKKVTKVGKKYFEVEDLRTKFHLEDGRESTDYSPFYTAYLSIKEFEEYLEQQSILAILRETFSYGRSSLFTLDQLRQVKKILFN